MNVPGRVRFVFVVLVLLGMPVGTAVADPLPMLLESSEQLKQLREARDLMIEFRFQRAESGLVALSRSGASSAAMHHLAVISLVKGLMTDDEKAFDDFFARSDQLKALLREQPNSRWRDLLEAENELNRTIAHAKRGSLVRAAMSGRSAYGAFETLAREHPDFPEVHKGLGILKLSLGTLSGGYRRVLSLLGYRGSVGEGLHLLLKAFRESEFGREEAGIYLALLIAQVERSSDEPIRILSELHEERPDSPLMAFLYGYMLLHHRQAVQAEHVLRPLMEEEGYRDIEYARFYLAQSLLVQDRFEEAASHFQAYLREHEGPSLRAHSILSLGLSLEMAGDRDAAVTWYRRVDDSRGHENDEAAGREAEMRISQPIRGVPRTLLLARNAFDSGRYERAQTLLHPLISDGELSAAERAEAAYRLGRSYHAEGRHREALAWYAQGAADPDYIGGRWAPWGHFYRGEIFELMGDHERAREEYERAASFSHEYDYAISLQSSVRASLELIP